MASDGFAPPSSWPVPAVDNSHTAADLTDEELMTLVQDGDNAAFAVLMRRHARVVLAVGRRVLREQGAAEDLVQDVFLLVHKRSHLFNPERGSLRGWLVQIAYNEAYRTRQRLNLRHLYEEQAIEDCEEIIAAVGTPEYHALLAQNEQVLRKVFQGLGTKQAQTLELFFFEGYTLREISDRTGDSLGNIRHYYYRALKELKAVIGAREAKDQTP